MIRSVVALGFLLAAPLLFAQAPPPRLEPLPEVPAPPPGVRDIEPDEPRVRIAPDAESVEEVREGGRVVMYTTGSGNWMRRDSLDEGTRAPMWRVFSY
jgi:hypothetical protein